MTYSEKLKDPRWQKKRLEVMAASNWRCEECDATGDMLTVHHSHYFKDTEPWDYEIWLLHCLCEKCHARRAETEETLKIGMMRLLRHVPECRLRMMAWKIIGDALSETQSESEQEHVR